MADIQEGRRTAAMLSRRDFFKVTGAAGALGTVGCSADTQPARRADHTLRISRGLVELAPDRVVSTTLYNGQFPGPLLRFTEGKPTLVDVYNDTDIPEQLHWHGQTLPAEVDGAAEEGTPFIPARGMRRIAFTPGPAGFRFYHTHLAAGADLGLGQYTGQVGPVYIEPKRDPGAYDQEVFVTLKEFEPAFSRKPDMPHDFLAGEVVSELLGQTTRTQSSVHGYEVGYRACAVNGRMLGHGEPIRVKTGERVLLHILNGSATENHGLALPGHTFTVIALDGNPVPKPVAVPVLWLGTAERISAIVEMTTPGVWVLGDLSDTARDRGMGIVVEYSGHSGSPRWVTPPAFHWDYRLFTASDRSWVAPERGFEMLIEKHHVTDDGFTVWTINRRHFSMDAEPILELDHGKRYRLRLRNASGDIHPMHLHRHSFEITAIAGTPTAGLHKDVVMLGSHQVMEIDFVADQTGLSLLHCHMQLHMDYGLMALLHCR
ncbi:multicopper oxidase domain-containing protein [Nocardia sp. 004]|uniref:multicopper oxidase domain-containing protein n=1 Tax=Nocardia sp. 004 TaxID=3385978 RepID=UPI0039A25976